MKFHLINSLRQRRGGSFYYLNLVLNILLSW